MPDMHITIMKNEPPVTPTAKPDVASKPASAVPNAGDGSRPPVWLAVLLLGGTTLAAVLPRKKEQ